MGLILTLKNWLGVPAEQNDGCISTGEYTTQLIEGTMTAAAFNVCTEMIASAIGRCDFRTFVEGKERREREFYLWNYEPNEDQNSTEFLHKLANKLIRSNEVLIVEGKKRGELPSLYVADSFTLENDEINPTKANVYTSVTVGDYTFPKRFLERDVLHLKLRNEKIFDLSVALTTSAARLMSTAEKYYKQSHGRQLKQHIDAIRSGQKDFEKDYTKLVNDQIRPFMNGENTVLPEFDGYTYTDISRGNVADSGDVRSLAEDIFNKTAQAFGIPAVLVNGKVEATGDALARFLTNCVDPICDQLSEEITRKRYGYTEWAKGSFVRVDSSSIQHFDMFANAANLEKLVGAGAFTINDILRSAGQPESDEPWANEHYLTLNIERIESSARSASQAKGG